MSGTINEHVCRVIGRVELELESCVHVSYLLFAVFKIDGPLVSFKSKIFFGFIY